MTARTTLRACIYAFGEPEPGRSRRTAGAFILNVFWLSDPHQQVSYSAIEQAAEDSVRDKRTGPGGGATLSAARADQEW